MKNFKLLIIPAAVYGVMTGGIGQAEAKSHSAASKDAQIEALTRRLELLEKKLAESESRTAPVTVGQATPAENPVVRQLDQKVKVIERKLEVEKEINETAKKSSPKIEAGPSGFRLTSADGAHQLRLRGFAQADGDFFMDDSHSSDVGVGLNASGQPNPIQQGTGLGVDKFWIRRARLQFDGTLFKYADFRIAPDFAQGQARLFDAWVDLHYFPFASVAAGKQKGPVSLERLQSATNLLFAERAYPTQLAPNRDIGVMLHGEFSKPGYQPQYSGLSHSNEFLSYQVGVFNGTADNQAVQNSDNATFDNKDFEGRVFTHPFQHSGISQLEGLGFGVAGTYGTPTRQSGLPNLVSPGQNTILSYSAGSALAGPSVATAVVQANTPATGQQTTITTTTTQSSAFSAALANGERYRIYPQGYWYWGPFGLFGEYAYSSEQLAVQQTDTTTTAVQTSVRTNVAPGTTTTVNKTATTVAAGQPQTVQQTRQNNKAWQVAASYVVTGEDNTYNGVKPRHAFDPLNGEWGALQVAARWSELDIDKDTFKNFGTESNPRYLFADPRNSVQHAQSWAVGLNWFLNQNIKLMADYEQTHFTGGAVNTQKQVVNRPDERVFFTRFQVAY